MSQSSNSDQQDNPGADEAETEVQEAANSEAISSGGEDETSGQRSSFAGMALRFLILVLVVFGLAIWALPHIAPRLPDSVAKNLFPNQQVVDQRLTALETKLGESNAAEAGEVKELGDEVATLKAQIAELRSQLEAAESEATAARTAAEEAAKQASVATVSETVLSDAGTAATRAAEAADTATSAATEAGTVASSAMRNTAALSRRVTGFEAQMTALSEEISAISDGLANANVSAGGDSAGGSPELAAAYNALKARVDGLAAQIGGSGYLTETEAAKFATQDDLRSTRTALSADLKGAMGSLPEPKEIATTAQIDGMVERFDEVKADVAKQFAALKGRVDNVEAAATSAAESASAAQAEVGGAIRDASLRSAVAALQAQLSTGLPFAASLEEVASLSEQAAPDALAAAAATGVATPGLLLKGFGQAAQDAVAADLRASADGNVLGQATARLRSLAAGRPKDAQEGEEVTAILSRVEAAIRGGELAAAQGEAESLPEAAAGAIAGWLGQLKARVAADAALADYVAGLGGAKG